MENLWYVIFFTCLAVRQFAEAQRYQNCVVQKPHSLVCSNFTNESDLEDDLRLCRRTELYELIIANSSLRYLPHGAFRDTKFETIKIENCDILGLSDTDVAFEGLENTLGALHIYNCSPVSHLQWKHLRHLKRLNALFVLNSDLDLATDEFSNEMQNLDLIRLSGNRISWIHETAFAKLKMLFFLLLNRNEISTFHRSMLPNPAQYLEAMDLSYNQLSDLPSDIFTNMPSLIKVTLNGNKLFTLDEQTFLTLYSGGFKHFSSLQVIDNPLLCDCRMKWTTELEVSRDLMYVVCDRPSSLKGQLVWQVNPRELRC